MPKLCREVGYDWVVMGTVTDVGLPGYLIGRTAETLLNEVSTSVLTPEGWISPIGAADG